MLKRCTFMLLLTIIVLKIFPGELTRAAVLDFNAKRVESELADAIVENLITELVNSGSYEIIERNQLEKLMEEQNLQNSDDFNDDFRQELGNLYGAELVFLGSVNKLGSKLTVNVRGVEVNTGVVRFAKSFSTSSEDEIPELLHILVSIVTGQDTGEKQRVKDENYIPDNKFSRIAKPFQIVGNTFAGLTALTLTTGFITLGVQVFFNFQLNTSSVNSIIRNDTERANFTTASNYLRTAWVTLITVGSICLVTSIGAAITVAILNNKAKNYSAKQTLNLLKYSDADKLCMNVDIRVRDDSMDFGLILSF